MISFRSLFHGRTAGAALLALAGVLCSLLTAPTARAQQQTGGDGSIYSYFGLGELRSFSSSQTQAMGGGGLALRSLNYTGFANPALWSDQEFTRLALGARYRRVDASNEAGQHSRLSNGGLDAVQFSFPLYTGEMGVGVGFQPYSRVEYRVQGAERFVTPAPTDGSIRQDSTTYRIRYEGEGGLQEISGGLGYRLGDALALGVRGSVIFGIIEGQRRTAFSSAAFLPTTLSRRTSVAGVTATAGALLSLSDVLLDEDALSVGATFTLPTRLSGERVRTLGDNLDRDTLALDGSGQRIEEGALVVPLSGALGISYKPSDRWTVIADGRYEPWSRAENDFATALPGFEGLRDRLRASAGAEFLPAGTNRNASFFERTGYRLGGYYEQSYVGPRALPATATAGVDILAATGGLSLPTAIYGTRIDVGVEVGTRGTVSNGLVRDLFYGISLNINFGERWFQRRRLR